MIPLSRVVNSEVNYESVQRLTLVVSLSKKSPHPIGNSGGIPHRPRRRIKGMIPQSRIDNPMTKKLIQHPLISGQLLPLWAQLRIKPPQRHQSLVPNNVVQGASRCPRRASRPLIGMIHRCDDLQERLILYQEENNRTYLLRSQIRAKAIAACLQRLPFGLSHLVAVVGHKLAGVDQSSR